MMRTLSRSLAGLVLIIGLMAAIPALAGLDPAFDLQGTPILTGCLTFALAGVIPKLAEQIEDLQPWTVAHGTEKLCGAVHRGGGHELPAVLVVVLGASGYGFFRQ